MAIGVILVNQSLAMNPAGNNSLFNYTGSGLGGAKEQITESGLINTINYYIGLSSRTEYVGFDAPLIPPDSEIDSAANYSTDNFSDDVAIVIINNHSLIASANFSESAIAIKRETFVYEVKPGDTPSDIADRHGISTNTMLWANNLNLSSATRIKPGDKLVILPVSGVRHVIKKNETLASITKKYSANKEEILAYNSLKEEDILETDSILIIPDGKMPAPPAPAKPKVVLASISTNNTNSSDYNTVNTVAGDDYSPAQGLRFPWGQCTYYIATRRYIPWSGHAKSWLVNASAYGFKTGGAPRAGAIIVTTENPRYGHVAYVEAVSGDGKITVSEMNFVGLGIKSARVISAGNSIIRGYIYSK
ncbi:LysM peptidoglycan-binding domain-containing protein [Patescibacteria group bacterium]|nr:LysM peptidoglycan-binding domain-containing protein [Patescibacteria group bacterium]